MLRLQPASHQIIRCALKNKHFHEVSTLGAYRPRHPHLGLSLGGQHYEDQKDQHQPGCNPEKTGNDKNGGKSAGGLFACIQCVTLYVINPQLGLLRRYSDTRSRRTWLPQSISARIASTRPDRSESDNKLRVSGEGAPASRPFARDSKSACVLPFSFKAALRSAFGYRGVAPRRKAYSWEVIFGSLSNPRKKTVTSLLCTAPPMASP